MIEQASAENVAEVMYSYLLRAKGIRRVSPSELINAASAAFEGRVDRALCKVAIRQLVDSGRCVYSYFGSTAIEAAGDNSGEE